MKLKKSNLILFACIPLIAGVLMFGAISDRNFEYVPVHITRIALPLNQTYDSGYTTNPQLSLRVNYFVENLHNATLEFIVWINNRGGVTVRLNGQWNVTSQDYYFGSVIVVNYLGEKILLQEIHADNTYGLTFTYDTAQPERVHSWFGYF